MTKREREGEGDRECECLNDKKIIFLLFCSNKRISCEQIKFVDLNFWQGEPVPQSN